ncbi:MAG TPA: YjgN family protein [Steroidobacteraceae bacterium]|nr:YjgN family protein [Steroidobacteraceae bacterium]
MNENPYERASPVSPPSRPNPEPASRVMLPFEFRGNGGEYFRIWIVNLLLTIITLGIYSAWAKVRRLRYFYGNTFVDGQSFDYHGQPLAILKGRLIVVAGYVVFFITSQMFPVFAGLLAVVLALFGVPWIIMRSRKFQMRMTSYRNLRFNFHGQYGGAMAAFIGWYFLALFTLGILFPVWLRKRVQYSLDNSSYGNQHFSFLTDNGTYYKFCIVTLLLGIAVFVGFIAVLTTVFGINAMLMDIESMASFGIWVVMFAFIVALLGVAGYYQASSLNAAFGGVQVGSQYVRSYLKAWPLIGIYVSNLFAIVFTLGLYYPWAKVRQVRYQLENMAIDSDGNLEAFTASSGVGIDAVGEEVGDFFDVDFGI